MCQAVTVAVAAAAVLLGSLLLLLCAEETTAKVNSFNLADCKDIVFDFRATYCYGVVMAAKEPPADSNDDTVRKRRDSGAVLQTGGTTEDSTKKSKESHREIYKSKDSPKSAEKFSEFYKRNPFRRSSAAKLNKAAEKRTEDLLGFNASKEELADIYNSSAAREPRNLRSHCSKENEDKIRRMMEMFNTCCPDLKKCLDHRPHVKRCYYYYKNSCHLD